MLSFTSGQIICFSHAMADQKAIIVGISGCSSSGKTTLARLLRDIFPDTFILHEDDFYKPEEQQVGFF